MNWNAILLAVITIAVVALVIFLIQLVQRLTRVATAVETTLDRINQLSPRVEAVLISAERELDHLSNVTERLDQIVADAQHMTSSVSSAVAPIAAGLGAIWKPLHFVTALLSGVKTGVAALSSFRGGTKAETSSYGRREDGARVYHEDPDERRSEAQTS